MSFSHGLIEAQCDRCEMETEPLDTNGDFDEAARQLSEDGWVAIKVTMNYELLCPDCQSGAGQSE